MTLYSAMARRKSVRTFEPGYKFTPQQLEAIMQATHRTSTPFGSDITMTLIEAEEDGTPRRLGTYGVISGATAYLAIATADTPLSRRAAGYAGEEIVLLCTSMGLATCWLGGTFRRSRFSRLAAAAPGQALSLVIAIGAPATRTRLIERLGRRMARSDSRKPFTALFTGPADLLQEGSALSRALEAVRIAPSSVNSQPWRAEVGADGSVAFSCAGSAPLNDVDMGIACCHFAIAARALGLHYGPCGPDMTFRPR